MTTTNARSSGQRLALGAAILVFVGAILIIIYFSQTRETERGSTVRKKPARSGQNQAPAAEKLPPAPKPAEGGQLSVSMESVTLQLSGMRDELKKKEKARALQIAKVDSPVISHIKFLIPSPPETEVNESRNRLDGILSAAAGVVSPPEETRKIRAEFEDYFSCGKTKYKIRTLSSECGCETQRGAIRYRNCDDGAGN